jgi:predicted CopG family antitoxin
MSKTIKVENEVYQKLDEERQKGETFSQVVAWLLRVAGQLKEVTKALGPGHYLHDVKKYQENVTATVKEKYQGEDGVWYEREVPAPSSSH